MLICPRRRAFTLTEVLIAIAVIACLAALLHSALDKARREALSTRCMGNLRTIHIGLTNFINDRGHYPGMRVTTRPTTWHHALEPYITGLPVPVSTAPAAPWAQCPAKQSDGSRGYGYNQYFGNIPPTASDFSETSAHAPYWALRPARIVEPTKKVVIGDGRDDGVQSGFTTNALRTTSNPNDALLPRRHSRGGFYLFADGHIEHLTAVEFANRVRTSTADFLKPF